MVLKLLCCLRVRRSSLLQFRSLLLVSVSCSQWCMPLILWPKERFCGMIFEQRVLLIAIYPFRGSLWVITTRLCPLLSTLMSRITVQIRLVCVTSRISLWTAISQTLHRRVRCSLDGISVSKTLLEKNLTVHL